MGRVIPVLYEDNHLLVIDKPAGLSTMGDEQDGAWTVHRWACDYLREKYGKPGRVYVGIVHRLDRLTSGVMVLARTSKAAARLSDQFRRESASNQAGESVPEKVYLAVIRGRMEPPQGELRDWLVKSERRQRMEVVRRSSRVPDGAVEAVSEYRSVRVGRDRSGDEFQLLQVELRTGRKHQIRVQFGDRGHPIDRDVKYSGDGQAGLWRGDSDRGIGLHAWRLSLDHPTTKTRMSWQAPIPNEWEVRYPFLRPWP